jgi:hypothetical protein
VDKVITRTARQKGRVTPIDDEKGGMIEQVEAPFQPAGGTMMMPKLPGEILVVLQ